MYYYGQINDNDIKALQSDPVMVENKVENVKACANIHDGWAIARIMNADGTNFYVKPGMIQVEINDLTSDEINLLMKKEPIRGLTAAKDLTIYVKEEIEGFNFDFSFRGDQLRMFIRFNLLDKGNKKADIPFYNFITKKNDIYEQFAKELFAMLNLTGGKKLARTAARVQLGGRNAVVYQGPRGGKYVKMGGSYVALSKAVKAAQEGGKKKGKKPAKKC